MTTRYSTSFQNIPNTPATIIRLGASSSGSAAGRIFNFKVIAEGGKSLSFRVQSSSTGNIQIALDEYGTPLPGSYNCIIDNIQTTSTPWRDSTSQLIYVSIETDDITGYGTLYIGAYKDYDLTQKVYDTSNPALPSRFSQETYTEPNILPVMRPFSFVDMPRDSPTIINLMDYSEYADPSLFMVRLRGSNKTWYKSVDFALGNITINDNGTATFTPSNTFTAEYNTYNNLPEFQANNQHGSGNPPPTPNGLSTWNFLSNYYTSNNKVKRTYKPTYTTSYINGNTSLGMSRQANIGDYNISIPDINVKMYTTANPGNFTEFIIKTTPNMFGPIVVTTYNNTTGDITFSNYNYPASTYPEAVVEYITKKAGVRSSASDQVVFEITTIGDMYPYYYFYSAQDTTSLSSGTNVNNLPVEISEATVTAPPYIEDKITTADYQSSKVINIVQGGTSGSSDFDLSSLEFNFDGTWVKELTTTGGQTITANTNGTITVYTGAGFSGAIPTFQVRISNLDNLSDTANIDITVSSTPKTTTKATDENGQEYEEGQTITVDPIPYTSSPKPLDPTTVKVKDPVTGVYGPGYTTPNGSMNTQPDGTVVWTPNPEYKGPVPDIDYTVEDEEGKTYSGIIVVPTVPEKTPPVLVDKTFEGISYEAPTTFDIMSGQSDGGNYPFDMATLKIKSDTGSYGDSVTVSHGVFTLNPDGSLLWEPNGTTFGAVDPITMTISNTAGKSDTATISVVMIPEQTPPVLVDKDLGAGYNRPTILDILTGQDSGNSPFNVSSVQIAPVGSTVWAKTFSVTQGAYTVEADGTVTFTPVDGSTGLVEGFDFIVYNTSNKSDTATVTVTVGPVPTPPVLVDKEFIDTPYETETILDVLTGQNSGNYSFSRDTAVISADGVTFSKSLSLPEGSLTVRNDGNLTWIPARTYEGPVPLVTYSISNTEGLSDTATLTITVQTEPPFPVVPISPLVGPKWVLGTFSNGQIEYGSSIPYISDKIRLDIHGNDEADITIPMAGLSDSDRLNWRGKFEVNEKFMALVDSNNKTITAGFIEKRNIDIDGQTLSIKLGSFKKWLSTLFAVNGERTSITKADEVWTLTASPRTVVKNIVAARLNNPNMPQSVEYPASRPGAYTKKIILSELVSIADIIDEISTDPSGAEIRFIPKKVDDKIVWVLVGGSPHINDDGSTIVMNLEDPNGSRYTFAHMDDGSQTYNKVWLESKFDGQVDNNINLKSLKVSGTKLVREMKEKFDVTLTDAELQAQFDARLEDANKINKDNDITILDDHHSYYGSVGRRLSLVGSGRSAGLDDTVRIVAVEFSSLDPLTTLTVSNIRKVYPLLPKDGNANLLDKSKKITDNAMKWDTGYNGSDGFETSPTDPTNPGENSGGEGFTIEDLWGDEGMMTGEAPEFSETAIFEGYNPHVISPNLNDGGLPTIDPVTIDKNIGNTLMGLDHNYDSYSWTFDGARENIKFSDLIPAADLKHFYSRTCFLKHGTLSTWQPLSNFSDYVILNAISRLNFTTVTTEGSLPQSYGDTTVTIDDIRTKINLEVGASIFYIDRKVYLLLALVMTSVIVYDYTSTTNGVSTTRTDQPYSKHVLRGGTILYSVDDNIWVTEEGSTPNNIFVYPNGLSHYGNKLVAHQGLDIPGYEELSGTHFQAKLPALKPRQVNIIRATDGVWYSFPTTPLDGQSLGILESYSYNGWLYVVDGFSVKNGGLYRIRLTDSGIVPPDAIWVPTAEKVTDIQASYTHPTGFTGISGNLIYFNGQNLVTRKINRADGTLGVESTIPTPYSDFFQGRGTDNSNDQTKGEYFNWINIGSNYVKYSHPYSYGGYAYMIKTNQAEPGKFSITSMRLEDGQGGTGSETPPPTDTGTTDPGTGGTTDTVDQSQEFDAANTGSGLEFWTTNASVGSVSFYSTDPADGLDFSIGLTPNQVGTYAGSFPFSVEVRFHDGPDVGGAVLHSMTVAAPSTDSGSGGTTGGGSVDQTLQYDADNTGSALEFWTTNTTVGSVSFYSTDPADNLDWSMPITPNQVATYTVTTSAAVEVRFHVGESVAGEIVHSMTIPAPSGGGSTDTVVDTSQTYDAERTSNGLQFWTTNTTVESVSFHDPAGGGLDWSITCPPNQVTNWAGTVPDTEISVTFYKGYGEDIYTMTIPAKTV